MSCLGVIAEIRRRVLSLAEPPRAPRLATSWRLSSARADCAGETGPALPPASVWLDRLCLDRPAGDTAVIGCCAALVRVPREAIGPSRPRVHFPTVLLPTGTRSRTHRRSRFRVLDRKSRGHGDREGVDDHADAPGGHRGHDAGHAHRRHAAGRAGRCADPLGFRPLYCCWMVTMPCHVSERKGEGGGGGVTVTPSVAAGVGEGR